MSQQETFGFWTVSKTDKIKKACTPLNGKKYLPFLEKIEHLTEASLRVVAEDFLRRLKLMLK